ncbi:hypothetical protein TNCV_2856371 [Trichonephila clavipes]|nr:hypothetical protein TNCV_2856371 [Trichonephila clavipes]
MCKIEGREIHHDKGLDCTPVVFRGFEHHAGDNTIWLCSPPPNFEGELPGGGQREREASQLSSLTINFTRGLAAQRLLDQFIGKNAVMERHFLKGFPAFTYFHT